MMFLTKGNVPYMKKISLFLLTLVVGTLAACSSASSNQPVEITLDVNSMIYQPSTIEVVAGQPVKLTFRNNDVVDHDFSIMEIPMTDMHQSDEPMASHEMATEPELHMAVIMGQTGTIQFTPTTPGTYEFLCTFAGHKEAGMVGTLIVKAP
jgi:uncharacterized cupredoxin-like copper-binding protein